MSPPALVRFPGGKHGVASQLARYFDPEQPFIEPFAGGASVTLAMARRGCKEIVLSDLDASVVNLWQWIQGDVEAVIDKLPEEVTTTAYAAAKEVLGEWTAEAAAAKIIVLRASMGAYGHGPIGGWDQSGKWKIGARWNYRILCRCAREHSARLRGATILQLDALEALMDWGNWQAFVDPPYVVAGPVLYEQSVDHGILAEILLSRPGPFVLTIDDPSGYEGRCSITPTTLRGNRKASEEFVIVRGTPVCIPVQGVLGFED